ncbi:DMT family transporter [Anaerotignum sp.]|uniref:DMT family transporter n=1 Tax=Anaerotignum sp. TaxID=2039241 RepID=UPI0028A2D905|nr:DMT family transporter [Anaerotignum sp.]
MYKSMAALDGVLIGLMVVLNGLLASKTGNTQSLVIIHGVGLLGSIVLLIGSRTRLISIQGLPYYLFTAGALGIFTVLFNNSSFLMLGATLTLCLNLLGQLFASMIIDHFGLLGQQINRVNFLKLLGAVIMILGIIAMKLI